MRPRDPRATARRLAPPLVAVLLVAACGGAAASPTPTPTPTPSATPAATPSPSPSPADVSAAFIKIITAPDYAASATVSGSVSIAGIEGTLSGDALQIGDDSSSRTVIEIAGNKQTNESIEQGPSSPGGAGAWGRKETGPWVEVEPSGDPSLFEAIAGLGGLEDVGVVTKDGQSLHHLRPAAGSEITPESLGFDVKGAKDPAFTMDLYATDDGTPAVIDVNGTWTQVTGTNEVPIDVDVEYVISEPTAAQTIEPPADPWTLFTSKPLKYEMAHPAEWTVEPSKTQDAYLLDGQPYVYVAPEPKAGSMTTAQFAAALKKSYKAQFGAPTSETDTRLGGLPAKRMIFEFKNKSGQDVTLVDDVTVRDGTGWEVFVATTGGRDDIPIFDQFVSTFAFTE